MTSNGGVIEYRRYLHTIWARNLNLEMPSQNQNTDVNLQIFYTRRPTTMSEQYMRYEGQLRVMICRLCHDGVTKNGVALHYRKYHRDLPLRIRQDLVPYANRFDRCETDDIQYPSTIISRIEELEVHENGVRCLYDNCNEAFPLQSSMEKHCGEEHGWIKSKGSGITVFFLTLCIGVMWTICDVQTLFKGNICKYFPVRTTPLLENAELD
jgi:hypothetical protein